jgi:uncharacterized protein YacL
MTPITTINLLRLLFIIASCVLGAMIGGERQTNFPLGAAEGLLFSLVLVLADRVLKGLTLRVFSSATFGLLLGLTAATILRASNVLEYLQPDVQWLISLLLYAAFGYLGMMLAIRSNRDEFSLLIPYVRFSRQTVQEAPMIVDTNIIIDGRVQAVCAAGFLSGSLVVPRFVLEELQRMGDSSDPVKRERGRRGFENLEKMRRASGIDVTIHDGTGAPEGEDLPVDARLVNLARFLQSRLLTNDAGLARLARLQNLTALSLHDLAAAMRPVITVGDELELHLVKEGRDPNQAVGYLADGTMIVVNNGRSHIGDTVGVRVTSALQTAGGRLVFADLRNGFRPN